MPPQSPSSPSSLDSDSSSRRGRSQYKLVVLLTGVHLIDAEDLYDHLVAHTPNLLHQSLSLHALPVPLNPPASQDHAATWSALYWPTIFNNTNPFGPHPSLVARTKAVLEEGGNVARWMGLAEVVGEESVKLGRGLGVGVVITERRKLANRVEKEIVVSVAGDARFSIPASQEEGASKCGARGNPAAHAILRAIDLVAQKRRRIATPNLLRPISRGPNKGSPSITHTNALSELTPLEQKHFSDSSGPEKDGYLCLGLNVYVTHEPCVMCGMALLHSRVANVVFGREMAETGSYAVGGKAGQVERYGLFWRGDLNWRVMGWRFDAKRKVDGDDTNGDGCDGGVFASLPGMTHA